MKILDEGAIPRRPLLDIIRSPAREGELRGMPRERPDGLLVMGFDGRIVGAGDDLRIDRMRQDRSHGSIMPAEDMNLMLRPNVPHPTNGVSAEGGPSARRPEMLHNTAPRNAAPAAGAKSQHMTCRIVSGMLRDARRTARTSRTFLSSPALNMYGFRSDTANPRTALMCPMGDG
eukprot:scaffold3970_cov257-Pinguiococcus_pyrenoidosus.AAC.5